MGVFLETVMTMGEAARSLPRPKSPCCVWRWCSKGVKGVRLEYARQGRTYITSKEALDRFFTALRALDEPPPVKRRKQSERSRQADIARAVRELEAAGVLKPGARIGNGEG